MLRKLSFTSIFCLFVLVLPLILPSVDISAEEQEIINVREPNQIRLAAWNIRFLGGSNISKIERNEKDLEKIAQILARYDFIAVTELMKDTAHLKKILEILSKAGDEYCSLVTKPIKKGSYVERYAFLYRKGLIKLIDKGDFYPHTDIDGDGKNDFSRNPYWATFRAGNFDFSVIVSHILWDKGKGPPPEHEKLGAVFQHVQDQNGEDEEDVILVGDFNLNPDSPDMFLNLDTNDGNLNDDLRKRIEPAITPVFYGCDIKSYIKDTSLYDNIFFQRMYVKEYTGKSGIFYFDEVMFGGDDDKAERVSDHRPVWADFRIDLDDDDPSSNADTKDCHLHDVGTFLP